MLILKLSLLRSTLRQVPLGPCLPTAKRLSRAGVPAASDSGIPALRDAGTPGLRDSGTLALRHSGAPARWHSGTCPPLASKNGHNPSMPFARCQEWTCSVRLDTKSEHVHRIGHLEWTCSALRALTAGQNLHYRERPLDMPLGGGREHWTCPAAQGDRRELSRGNPWGLSRPKPVREGVARRPGPPRNRPSNQALPPRNLVTCLTKLSHDAPGRTEARRYCGIHE
jgi:hypothetical protein